MKHLFFSFLIFASIQLQAQLVSTTLLDSYTLSEIEVLASDFGVPAGVLPLSYAVDYYRIEYQTLHPNGETVLVSGGLAVPQGVTCPRPLASYQHGTTTERYEVPGYQNTEALLGVLYASGGFVCTLPDFIGLGSSDLFHLYVHAESQASASLDFIRLATEELNEDLNYTWDGQLFLFGYSQGGHATMALHKSIEEDFSDEFTVTASAPMSGPYDISGAQTDYLLEDVPFSFSGFLPYVTIAYQNAYGNLYNSLDEIFVEPYATTLPDLFDGSNSIGYISSQLPAIPSEMLIPEVYAAFQSDPDHFLRQALEDNDVYDWAPTAPTRLYYCTEDEQVSYNNSLVALETMLANG
ncbi:MAG: lipase family protein, partial [Flavobacteriales bacterium]